MVYLFGAGLPMLFWKKRPLNGFISIIVIVIIIVYLFTFLL